MNKYCEIVDFIPRIPENLIEDIDTIKTKYQNLFNTPKLSDVYASYETSDQLHNYIQNFFDYEILVRYQLIGRKLPIHIDRNTVTVKYNYLITTGGDNVKTRWFDNNKNLLYETVCEKNKWYKLDIKTLHDITNINASRLSITVKEKSGH